MSGCFFLGYDVESPDPKITSTFVKAAVSLHEELEAPCTFFVLGRTLRHSLEALKPLVGHPLIDLQSHTESHVLMKTVCQENEHGIEVHRGGSFEEVRQDVHAAQVSFDQLLGFRPIGLTGPYNYYRGLCDRPDLVDMVAAEGIRFIRTWGRNEKDWQPTPAFNPFPLTALGHPEIWEYGCHGWQDCILRDVVGWQNLDAYFEHFRLDLEAAVAADRCFSYVQHDWSSIKADEDMVLTKRIITHARGLGMRVVDYAAHYREQVVEPAPPAAQLKSTSAGEG